MTTQALTPLRRRREPFTQWRGEGRPRKRPHLGQPLSQREQQVADLICADYTNPEIAERLCVCEKTVEMHVTWIRLKRDLPNGRVRRGQAWRAVFGGAV